jgi:hypothetical protein
LWKNSEGMEISSRGASGGILIMWDTSKIKLEASFCSQHWILTSFHCKDTSMPFTLINIYMPMRYLEKVGCWNSLYAIKENLDLPSCGIQILYKKKRGSIVCDPM